MTDCVQSRNFFRNRKQSRERILRKIKKMRAAKERKRLENAKERERGEDTRRLIEKANDLMREAWDLYLDKNNVPEEYVKAYSDLLFELDHAAMSETGRGERGEKEQG